MATQTVAKGVFGGKGAKKAGKGKAGAKKGKQSSPSSERKQGTLQTTNLDSWYGPDRRKYLPEGLLGEDAPEYLDGSLPGDYGYDPLGLGKDPEKLEKYRAAELIHARWAMLGAVGCFTPEAIANAGEKIKGATWWKAPFVLASGEKLNWFTQKIEIPLNIYAVAAINIALVGAAEVFRQRGTGPSGYAIGGRFDSSEFEGADPLHPGGPFDPLNFGEDPDALAELKVKEIKNGRLAMVAMLAFFIQGAVTKEGPATNLFKHLSAPFENNLLTVLGGSRSATL